MSKKESRGFEYNPTERSTDRPQGQRHGSDDDDVAGPQRNQAGTGASLQEYRFSDHNKARTRGLAAETVDDVYLALAETLEPTLPVTTVTSISLQEDADLEHSPNQVGKALSELVDTEDCPIYVNLWGGESTTPQRWEVSLPTDPVGVPPERLIYGAGTGANTRSLHISADCARLGRTDRTTSSPATHPPRGTVCDLCAPDLSMDDLGAAMQTDEDEERELVTDGGEDDEVWYVIDESRGAVVDGPHHERHTAETKAAGHTGPALVATESVIDMMRAQGVTIRWEVDDVDVLTDGGQPVDRSKDGAAGAIDNEFDDAERPAREQLIDTESASAGHPHHLLEAGDVAIDMVTRQPLLLVERVADDLAEYYEEHDFDLLNYKQHTFLPVDIDDAVFECVFIGGIDDLHSFSDTYDFPSGRLARVPVEVATGDDE